MPCSGVERGRIVSSIALGADEFFDMPDERAVDILALDKRNWAISANHRINELRCVICMIA